MRYSGFQVIGEALTGHKGWKPAWRDPEPSSAYDYVIIGGGGHGLATAYYQLVAWVSIWAQVPLSLEFTRRI